MSRKGMMSSRKSEISTRECKTRGRYPGIILTLFLLLTFMATPVHAQLNPGDILVSDPSYPASPGLGALYVVDPVSGKRRVLSDFNDPSQGPTGVALRGVAIDSGGKNIYVADSDSGGLYFSGRGQLFRVDPNSGQRKVLSDFDDPEQGPLGGNPWGVAIETSGDILVMDDGVGTMGQGALFRVDPGSGQRTLISDFGNKKQGPEAGKGPRHVAVRASGDILVLDASDEAGTKGHGALYKVNPLNGRRGIVSDFGDRRQGKLGRFPHWLVVNHKDEVLVSDRYAGAEGWGLLFRVKPKNGRRSIVSEFGDPSQGPLVFGAGGVEVETSGHILVCSSGISRIDRPGPGGIYRIDPRTGQRTLVTNFDDPSQGPLGSIQSNIALVPQKSEAIIPAIHALIDQVSGLVDSGVLSDRGARRLSKNLERALTNIKSGRSACRFIDRFLVITQRYLDRGIVDSVKGQSLIDDAQEIRTSQGCQ